MSEVKRCSASVHKGGRTVTFRKCLKSAVMEHDGNPYCGTHDPVKRAKRDAECDSQWREQFVSDRALRRMELAAPTLCKLLEKIGGEMVCVCRLNKIVASLGAGIPCRKCEIDAALLLARGAA